MKPTPLAITLQSTRLPDGQPEERRGTILIDVTDTDDGRAAGLVKLEGGSTGFESFRVDTELRALELAAENGWTACAGTEGSYTRCFVPAAEMRRVLDLFRATEVKFREMPTDVVTIYIGTDVQGDHTSVVALLNSGEMWRALAHKHGEPMSETCAQLDAVLLALDQLRHPCRINIITADERFADQIVEPDGRSSYAGETEERLWLKLDDLLFCSDREQTHMHHLLEMAKGAPAHLLVRACRRVAEKVSGWTSHFKHYRARRALLEGFEASAAMLNSVEMSLGSSEFSRIGRAHAADIALNLRRTLQQDQDQ